MVPFYSIRNVFLFKNILREVSRIVLKNIFYKMFFKQFSKRNLKLYDILSRISDLKIISYVFKKCLNFLVQILCANCKSDFCTFCITIKHKG